MHRFGRDLICACFIARPKGAWAPSRRPINGSASGASLFSFESQSYPELKESSSAFYVEPSHDSQTPALPYLIPKRRKLAVRPAGRQYTCASMASIQCIIKLQNAVCDSLRSWLHNSREAISSRDPRSTRTSAVEAKLPATLPRRSLQFCGGQQLDLGGGASYPALRCKLCVIGFNYAWNFTLLFLPAQSGASIGETGTHSRGSVTWQPPRQ